MSRTLSLSARGVLFDMDGTLVESKQVIETIWTDFAIRFGQEPAVVLRAIHGVRPDESIARFAPAGSDLGALAAELSTFEHEHSGSTTEILGARAFLAALPAARIGIVTSSPPSLMVARMRGAGLALPAAIVTADDVGSGKPAPDGYLLCAQKIGVHPADVVVFEDAEAGVAAALAAQMRVVVVGPHSSPITAGLPRIQDYSGASVSVDGAEIVLSLEVM